MAAIVDLEKQKSLRSKGGIPLEDIFADRRTIRLGTINRYQGWLQPEWDRSPALQTLGYK
jgi:hypothetical protein